ncbi:MAG: hypothetical protein ACSHX0_04390 [Akkermansiaceae bacterium]
MKCILPISFLALLTSAALQADSADDIEYGVEAVTGYRSDYVYRGFQLAESTIDFQIETEIALNNNTFLNIGSWYATETGDGDFSETAFFSHLRYAQTENLTLGLSATYRSIDQGDSTLSAFLDDGVEAGIFASYYFCDNFSGSIGTYYDTGAEGIYSYLEGKYSTALSDKAFLSFKLGLSAVDDYYDRAGLNDAYGRLSLTYNISDTVSVSPFVGTSFLLDDDDAGDDTTYGGIWFEVRF